MLRPGHGRRARAWRVAALSLLLGPAPAMAEAEPGAFGELRLLGQVTLPSGSRFADTPVGGLSGIDYDPRDGSFWAISDDRSQHAPARLYRLALDYDAQGFREVRFLGVKILRDADGSPHAPGSVDPEALRLDPASGHVYWSSEGDAQQGIAASVEEVDERGRRLRRFSLPPYYDPTPRSGAQGIRNNLALESLTALPGSPYLATATENALAQDGPPATRGDGSPCRVLVLDRTSGQAAKAWVYMTEPVADPPLLPGMYASNGVVELLGLGPDSALVLERSYSAGRGNRVRLYRANFSAASDVLGLASLAQGAWTPAAKTLVLDLDGLEVTVDNLEGMSWGPTLANGHRTLVLVSDDNFSIRQVTQFLAFELLPPPATPQ